MAFYSDLTVLSNVKSGRDLLNTPKLLPKTEEIAFSFSMLKKPES